MCLLYRFVAGNFLTMHVIQKKDTVEMMGGVMGYQSSYPAKAKYLIDIYLLYIVVSDQYQWTASEQTPQIIEQKAPALSARFSPDGVARLTDSATDPGGFF